MALSGKNRRLVTGGRLIDRSKPLMFRFNGRELSGYYGDTLATALAANDVRVVARSLKYHRPRGLFGTSVEDPTSMLAVRDAHGGDPAVRAGEVQLVNGLEATTLRGWPSEHFDVGSVAQLAAPLLAAGFYYKTFMWPSWKLFEPAIRASAGFGRPTPLDSRRILLQQHDTCDVLIIGAGPAGLAAAIPLANSGLRVVVAEQEPAAGGSLRWEDGNVDGLEGVRWANHAVERLCGKAAVVLTNTVVAGAYPGNLFTLVQTFRDERGVTGQCLWKLRANYVVVATGSIDRPLVFQANDRPGTMLATAVRRLVAGYAVAPCARLVLYTNNDEAYATAFAAHRSGLDVPLIVDTRPRPRPMARCANVAHDLGIECWFDSEITDTRGYKGITQVTVTRRDGRRLRQDCSGLAVSGGYSPQVHLLAQAGAQVSFDACRGMYLCKQPPDNWHIVGSAAGIMALDAAIRSGKAAAVAVLGGNTGGSSMHVKPDTCVPAVSPAQPEWIASRGKRSKMWVDLQNDVKVSDIDLAVREGYASIEHLKRYTTLGMGTDQGRTSNANGAAVLAQLTGKPVQAVGRTTFRPPYTPIRMDAITGYRRGNLYRPRRITPMHDANERLGAVFSEFGWMRPDWYETNGTTRENAVREESLGIREAVGLFDASPLGKFEVVGPDAAKFVNRFYISNLDTLKPGHARYSVMLRDNGTILDDGVVTCIDPCHYLVGTTSGNARTVGLWLERWHQIQWPHMRVAIVPVTSGWATVAIAGPRARAVLKRCEPTFDVSADQFKHMQFREGMVAGIPARITRVSYTGELQYEISVPARFGESLFDEIFSKGKEFGIRPVGMEAWLRLRLEKGYVHLGQDTNSRTIPDDIGMGKIAWAKTVDFIGKRSLVLSEHLKDDREQLVGLHSKQTLEAGARILRPGAGKPPCATEGYVTSACFSAALGIPIAMGLVGNGRQLYGETVRVYSSGKIVDATIGTPVFYDADNDRLRA